jgi:uncharacterized repeat protein (TIGR03809 family)
MTNRTDVARGDNVARWCALAEQRLEYLTELFETGRWRRYHSELDFLENIREAKQAVGVWQGLLTRQACRNDSTVDITSQDLDRAPPPDDDDVPNRPIWLQPQPVRIPATPPPSEVSMAVEDESVASDEAPCEPAIDDARAPTLDIASIQERYPSLRNALL